MANHKPAFCPFLVSAHQALDKAVSPRAATVNRMGFQHEQPSMKCTLPISPLYHSVFLITRDSVKKGILKRLAKNAVLAGNVNCRFDVGYDAA